ncbi:glutaredoxin domain-containing protein [Enterococcus plantarum]|uniref:glutaredoxin domain-containing protein n=1 Tax=Enterococcus plantarum TaxID=1077675 RepID=UPI001A8C3775|nr:glutaredoxin domain-containing protein [Enterococcus plantarum]MBO0422170.1 glutathione S-transferase N-terminal domain-containing protein [Enterococcus plantarum]
MLTLFQRETCPYCRIVRERMTQLGLDYICINLPKTRTERVVMQKITGNHFIPALIDGKNVIPGKLEFNQHILDYLDLHFDRNENQR